MTDLRAETSCHGDRSGRDWLRRLPLWGLPTLAAIVAGCVAVHGDHVDFDVYVRAGDRLLDSSNPYETTG
ncbi:MAG: hypothetical protein L0H79_21715, partial [Intrasporangium sp.]|uniref:hypothetical protein n=1 Tax=Intrasporangium sp. TaxID=1925024 RepID=UPI002649B13C